MLTPQRRRSAATNFCQALRLVLDAVDAAVDQASAASDGRTIDEAALKKNVVQSVATVTRGPGRKRVLVDIANKIADRLSPVDMVLLGTGCPLRHRELLLQTLENRIRNAMNRQAIEIQIADTIAASERPYANAPDWPDYLRTLAALLLIIAEIWEWFE